MPAARETHSRQKAEVLLNVKCARFHMSKQPAGKKMPATDSKDNGGISSSLYRIFVTKFVDQRTTEYQNKQHYNMQ